MLYRHVLVMSSYTLVNAFARLPGQMYKWIQRGLSSGQFYQSFRYPPEERFSLSKRSEQYEGWSQSSQGQHVNS